MGEVDQLDDAVHHRVAERDKGVDGAVGKAEDKDLSELGWVGDGPGRQQQDRNSGENEETEVGDAQAAETS
jgi:hypothetical protein